MKHLLENIMTILRINQKHKSFNVCFCSFREITDEK